MIRALPSSPINLEEDNVSCERQQNIETKSDIVTMLLICWCKFPRENHPMRNCHVQGDSLQYEVAYNIIVDSDYLIFCLGRFRLLVCNLVMILILTSAEASGRREDHRYIKYLS